MSDHYDVVIVGGGPVGAVLALSLSAAELNVALVEARSVALPSSGFRPLALSYGTRLILERLQVWRDLRPATPIACIHVSHAGRFGRVELTAQEAVVPALGYVVDYDATVSALDAAVAKSSIEVLGGSRVESIAHGATSARMEIDTPGGTRDCEATLIAIAEGNAVTTDVGVRTFDYEQKAITARVQTEAVHAQIAFERFTPQGPIALLPFDREYALVWTIEAKAADELVSAAPADFLTALHERFGERVGRFNQVEARSVHSLTLRIAKRVTWGRAVLLGNAAQTLHPVAGQGLNLGMRDAWELASEIRSLGLRDQTLFERYRAKRRTDRSGGIAFTDGLVRIFSNDFLPLAALRSAGLTLLDNIPPAKDFVVRRMIFGARG
jgi:2-octaprenyl-6-methoxyphenol hydroxylase